MSQDTVWDQECSNPLGRAVCRELLDLNMRTWMPLMRFCLAVDVSDLSLWDCFHLASAYTSI